MKSEKDLPELVRAAQELEDELVRLESISRGVRKLRLDSEKGIVRAAKELNEALALPERIALGLGALAKAMQSMQVRQQAALEQLALFATEIQKRQRRLEQHMEAFAALGQAAGQATELLQVAEPGSVLPEVRTRLASISESARTLFDSARNDDFPEVAREAESLKQRIAALERRLGQPN
jgi:hypothetical protein